MGQEFTNAEEESKATIYFMKIIAPEKTVYKPHKRRIHGRVILTMAAIKKSTGFLNFNKYQSE